MPELMYIWLMKSTELLDNLQISNLNPWISKSICGFQLNPQSSLRLEWGNIVAKDNLPRKVTLYVIIT